MTCCCNDRPAPSLFAPFDPDPFMPRIECGNWPPWLVTSWVVTSVGLLILYWTIAALLMITWHKTRDRNYPREYLPWIAAFFVGCGGGHVMNALAFLWPAYVAFVLWDWWTFAMSAVGAVGVYRIAKWSRTKITALEHQVDEIQHGKEEKEEEARRAWAAVGDKEKEMREEFDRRARQQRAMSEKLDGLKAYFESRLHKELTDYDYAEMRRRLHDLRGTM